MTADRSRWLEVLTNSRETERPFALLGGSILLLFLSGCGYISEPLPPLLNIPGHAENLTAVQRGANLIVHFTLPTLTTEGQVQKQAVRLDLRVGVKPEQFNADQWEASAKAVSGGTTANGLAGYQIPAAEWAGKEVAVAVKVIGAKNGRDAGWSNPVTLRVVAPPEAPHALVAASAPEGVRLTWQGAGSTFAISRRGPEEKDYSALGRSDKPEYIDKTAAFGKPYSYLVQSVVQAGEGEAQSEISNEAAVTPVDTFPPSAPTGLTAVPSTASVELVWERSTDPALAGYRVYRAPAGGAFERLADTQEAPTYSDRRIESGKTYRYAVTAVKKNGMESPPSAPAEVAAP